jgi:MFS family permease
MTDRGEEVWNWFLDEFCKVDAVCYGGEPNWLGWVVIIFAASIIVSVLYYLVFALVIGLFGAAVSSVATPFALLWTGWENLSVRFPRLAPTINAAWSAAVSIVVVSGSILMVALYGYWIYLFIENGFDENWVFQTVALIIGFLLLVVFPLFLLYTTLKQRFEKTRHY